MQQDYILAASDGEVSLPGALQQFYAAFKDNTPGEYTMGIGAGIDGIPYGPVTITVDNTRISVVASKEYESAINKDMELVVLQGYAQITLFDRFYASCILIGEYSPVNAGSIVTLVDHLTRTEEEREKLEQKKIDEVKIHPAFYTQIYNDPINQAESTCGIYIIKNNLQQTVTCETVFQAIGIADFADNAAFGLAIAVSANVNTFTNSMNFSVAASVRFAGSERFTVAGEIGILNGKLNAIGLSVKSKILIGTEVYLTQARFSVKGFQEPKVAVGFGGGMAFGSEIKIPSGLGTIQKALFPNLAKFHPLELTLNGELNPMRNYYTLTGQGTFMGNLAVSASFTYDDGDLDAELKAGTVRNNYLNGSLAVDYHLRKDSWSLHGNFSCSITVDFGKFVGISVSGGVDLLLNSRDYTLAGARYNRKDLTISVSGMGKVKIFFSFNISVQKTWVFNLSNTPLSDPKQLMRSISIGDTSMLENTQDVLVCESKDIMETALPRLRAGSDVIETKSWQIDEGCSKSGLVKFQVAAEYTLVDSSWRLTHFDGNTITVYTSENAGDIVTVQSFAHNYYELLLDTPDAGSWTLEILGDSQNSGGIYMDALQDEKIVTQLEILEETDSAIKFRYTAFTGSDEDTTFVRLCAEEISTSPEDNPYSGVIAYLEETENGEFIWEIPEEFRHNAQYRFYISTASSAAGAVTESNSVEIFLARQEAELECSWELAYSADSTDIVTAYITIKNTGAESTAFKWEILDYTNKDFVDSADDNFGNTSDTADILASGCGLEIKGNSTLSFQQVITITDELRDNPSSLLLSVTQETEDNETGDYSGDEEDEIYADDTDEITFSAMGSAYCQKQTISWQAVDGAASYILHYALEGDWEESGVYVNNIYGTSYVLSAAPGEYACRVIAVDSSGKAIGTWSEEEEIDILFRDEQTISIAGNISSSRSKAFSLNDGIYSLNGIDLHNFTGTLTLFRNDWVETEKDADGTTLKQTENDILTLTVVNGVLKNPLSEILLDNGEYFWKWSRTENTGNTDFDITLELSGEVFSVEQKDREIISIEDGNPDMPLIDGVYVETLEGEIGFCNEDAIYQYMTDDGGELSLTIKRGTVFEADADLFIYEQSSSDGDFDCVKTLTVKSGEYTADTVILNNLSIRNNFYVQIAMPDDGRGKSNTEYSIDLSFDAFEDNVQTQDILKVNGDPVCDWIGYRNEAHSYLLQIKSDDRYAVRLQGDAFDAVLKVCEVNGTVIEEKQIEVNGTAFIDDIYLESGNYFVTVESADNGAGLYNTDYILSVFDLKTLYPQIDNSDDTRELAALKNSTAFDTNVENWLGAGDRADFFKFTLSPENALTSSLVLTIDEKTALAVKDGLLQISSCDQRGETLTTETLTAEKLRIETLSGSTEIYIGISCDPSVEDLDYSFKLANAVCPGNLSGSAEGLSWDAVPGVSKYIVEYSSNNFADTFRFETAAEKVDFFGLSEGVRQWRVRTDEGGVSETGEIMSSASTAIQKLISEANGNTDVFFAEASGIWSRKFAAEHKILGGLAELAGKNKISAIFYGSDDTNVLILTDDSNGDALFLDDIYSAWGEQARLAQINEIRAGNGDDVVDMTSLNFTWSGSGVKIFGGLGDDTIWSNNDSNTLFGDAGNDRIAGGRDNDVITGGIGNDTMHGGGGKDIFTFGTNWGNDTVEQLAEGSVTLWFKDGSESNWNASTLTYSDGTNSVKVSGVSADNIALIFGDDSSLLYDDLVSVGCFENSVTEKIFEDKDKGILA